MHSSGLAQMFVHWNANAKRKGAETPVQNVHSAARVTDTRTIKTAQNISCVGDIK
jgi:hypothetical protein